MTLLAIVLVLAGLRWFDIAPTPRNATQGYLARARSLIPSGRFWSSPAAPWVLAVVPALIVGAIDARLPWFLHLVLATVVLWLTLGPRELNPDLKAWVAAQARGDEAEAGRRAELVWGDRPRELGQLFIESHERLFGVLIWFFVLGPAGGVLYRVGRRLPHAWGSADNDHARRTHAALAFVTARITAALFGAAGSADDVIAEWRRRRSQVEDWTERTWHWLSQIGAATLDIEEVQGDTAQAPSLQEGADEFVRLELRALLILLALFAIFTVGSWFG
jgi:AmpE protein